MVEARGLRPEAVDRHLFVVTCISLYGEYLPNEDRLPLPAWKWRQARNSSRAARRRTRANATKPIHKATMGMLLVWSLRFVEILSGDIRRANAARQAQKTRFRREAWPGDRERAIAGLEQLRQAGQPLPMVHYSGKDVVPLEYLGLRMDVAPDPLKALLKSSPWCDIPTRYGAPMDDVAIEGRIAGEPWTEAIDFYEVSELVRHLKTACMITIAYLSGMRVEEWRALTRGCSQRIEAGRETPQRFEISGSAFKNVSDSQWNTIPEGVVRDHPWWVIEEVHAAIAMLELIHGDDLLFSAAALSPVNTGSRVRAARTGSINRHIAAFIEWCNAASDRLGLPGIPTDPEGPIIGRRFRQTIARDVAAVEESLGEALLGLNRQFDHKTIAQTLSYVGGPSQSDSIMETQRALARSNRRRERAEALAAGDTVSGPAKDLYVEVVGNDRKVLAMMVTEEEYAQLDRSRRSQVYDHPGFAIGCAYVPENALCHTSRSSSAEVESGPNRSQCDLECKNVFRANIHIAHLRQRIDDLLRQMPYVPRPLQERFAEDIHEYLAIIADHERNGIQERSARQRRV